MKTKAALRTELKIIRASLPVTDVVTKSQEIMTALVTILKNVELNSLHVYEPIAKLREVDVSELFDLPDVTLYTSRKLEDDWHIVSTLDNIAKTEPRLDVIIVPLLGFDQKLQRIGYGGGYYDRLLAAYPNALKIGVCYESGKVEHVPAEPHDIPMDLIITETRAVIAVG